MSNVHLTNGWITFILTHKLTHHVLPFIDWVKNQRAHEQTHTHKELQAIPVMLTAFSHVLDVLKSKQLKQVKLPKRLIFCSCCVLTVVQTITKGFKWNKYVNTQLFEIVN